MALTAQQDIPKRPEEKSEWTFRRLFSFGAVSTLAKTFVNPFDVVLGYLVFIAGIAELFGRHVSWFYWVFTIAVLAASVWERVKPQVETKIKNKKK